MPEQVMSRRTIMGWLSALALMTTVLTADEPGPDDLSDLVGLPVGIIDLKGRRFLATSPSLRDLLGWTDELPDDGDIGLLVKDPNLTDSLFALLVNGSIDAYEAIRAFGLEDSSRVECRIWVVVWEQGGRHRALAVLARADADAAFARPTPTPAQWPAEVAGIVVGTLSAEWCVEVVSADIEMLLDYPSEQITGSSFIRIVHSEDVPRLLSTVASSLVDGAGVGAEVRLRHRNGQWLRTHLIITPLAAENLRFGFCFSVPSAERTDPIKRVASLERHLWRIAREVEASGVAAGFDRVPDPQELPGLADLSARQWEILTRLLRGERVPTIAEELYLSQSTVRNHLSDMFRKLGVHSQDELLRLLRVHPRQDARQGPPTAGRE